MNQNAFKKKFKKKILVTASAGLLLACLCVALTSVLPLSKELKELRANNLIFAAKTRSMVVEEFLAKAAETARQITSRSKIREFLEKYNHNEIDLDALNDFTAPKLQDALKLSEFAAGISRLDQQGKLVVQVGRPVPEKFLLHPEFTDHEPIIDGPITIDNQSFILVSAPIINRRNSRVGVDLVLFTTAKLRKIIQDYTGLGKTGETILGRLNEQGQPELFFPTRMELEQQSLNGAQPAEHAILAELALKKVFGPERQAEARLHETAHLLTAYGPITGIDWGILVRMEKAELFEPVTSRILTIALVIAGLVIPLGVLVLVFLLRPLSNRMLIHVDTLQREIKAKEDAIHERALTEKKLLDEKERLNVTLRSIGDGVITTDLGGNVVLINKVTEKLTGWRQSEALSRPVEEIFKIVDPKTGQAGANPVAEALTTGKIVGLKNHMTLIARDSRQCSIEDSCAPIFDEQSGIIGTVLVFRDVTEARKTEEELLKVKKLESIGVLAGGIAHDFNNILVAILGNIDLAGHSIDSSHKAHPLLLEAQKASLRAKDLTQQLLIFSRGGDPVKKTTKIGEIITSSAGFVLHGSPVSCRFEIPEDLFLVDIDPGQIGQVIQNLALNARQAMPEGGAISIRCSNIEEIRSEITLALPGKAYVKITVQDEGQGITKEHLEKIFDPYFTTKQEGSGLGLAICHSIINKHQGQITALSQPGKGTTFTIYLPASGRQSADAPADEAREPAPRTGARILIMDDEQPVQQIAGQMLKLLGHETLPAWDGREAIALFAEQRRRGEPIDVIIVDLTIPGGMGGQEAAREILKIDPDAKIMVASGYSNDPIMANYRQYGFKGAIIKPFLMADLQKTLNDIL